MEQQQKEQEEEHQELVLQHLIILIAKEAPFLDYWQYFEKAGFDVVRTLRNIGAEFIKQVNDDNIDNDYLLTRVTERYYDAVSYRFDWFGKSLLFAKNKKYFEEYANHNVQDKLHSYRLKTLRRLRTEFIKKVETIDKILEYDEF